MRRLRVLPARVSSRSAAATVRQVDGSVIAGADRTSLSDSAFAVTSRVAAVAARRGGFCAAFTGVAASGVGVWLVTRD